MTSSRPAERRRPARPRRHPVAGRPASPTRTASRQRRSSRRSGWPARRRTRARGPHTAGARTRRTPVRQPRVPHWSVARRAPPPRQRRVHRRGRRGVRPGQCRAVRVGPVPSWSSTLAHAAIARAEDSRSRRPCSGHCSGASAQALATVVVSHSSSSTSRMSSRVPVLTAAGPCGGRSERIPQTSQRASHRDERVAGAGRGLLECQHAGQRPAQLLRCAGGAHPARRAARRTPRPGRIRPARGPTRRAARVGRRALAGSITRQDVGEQRRLGSRR